MDLDDDGMIKLLDHELIMQKLQKLKCGQCAHNAPNYIVFDYGLFCPQCLAKLQEVPHDHLATLQDLSKIITELAQTHQKNIRNGNTQLVLKVQAEQLTKSVKTTRDSLVVDAKSIQSKILQSLSLGQQKCKQQSRNQALQNFFQPDITASVLLNDSQLLIENIQNLRVVETQEGVKYEFKEGDKNPQGAKKDARRQIQKMQKLLSVAQAKSSKIMQGFRASIGK